MDCGAIHLVLRAFQVSVYTIQPERMWGMNCTWLIRTINEAPVIYPFERVTTVMHEGRLEAREAEQEKVFFYEFQRDGSVLTGREVYGVNHFLLYLQFPGLSCKSIVRRLVWETTLKTSVKSRPMWFTGRWKGTFMLFLLLIAFRAWSQQSLDAYIDQGLSNNLALKERTISLAQAQLQLQDAKSLFLPSLNFSSSYTSGQGGRYFNFPVGDIVNPVYTALNQLMESSAFPQIENSQSFLNPRNLYDVHVRTSMPLLNTDLIYNRRIQSEQVAMKEYEADIYRRDLVRDIKTAYFNYLSSLEAVEIYENAADLLRESVRVNQSLRENGKALPANVLRAENELRSMDSQISAARNQVSKAGQYFNFLLNRPLDSPIDISYELSDAILSAQGESLSSEGFSREELRLMESSVNVSNHALKMREWAYAPKIQAFVDLGSQAENWVVDDLSRYYLIGLSVDVPIFLGGRNSRALEMAKRDLDLSRNRLQLMNRQLELSRSTSRDNLNAALQQMQSAETQISSAEVYFRLIDNGYRQGVNTFIEFLDARSQLTSSRLSLNLRILGVLSAHADLERENAAFVLPRIIIK